jgi:hypothetical protein
VLDFPSRSYTGALINTKAPALPYGMNIPITEVYRMNTYRLSIVTALLCLVATNTGCATNSELAKVQTEAREARQTADHALSLSQEANRRSERTEEMLSRSYKHSMRK